MTSVVLQTAFLGDVVLTTPLISRLAAKGPVDVVVTPAAAPLLANHPDVRRVIVYDKRGDDRGVHGVRRVAQEVEASGASAAYLAQGSMRTAAVARIAGIERRVGFDRSPGRVLYTERKPYRQELHHVGRLWTLASMPGDPVPQDLRPSLHPSPADVDAAHALLERAGITRDDPVIAFAPGSVWATKRWPSYDALAQRLAEHATLHDARIVVLGGEGDTAHFTAIAEALRTMGARPAVDATGQLSLLASAALIAHARLLVTNDSAPLHLASAMNTPIVAIFGPTVPELGFGPLSDVQRTLGHQGLTCRPCDDHGPRQCPLGHWRCMRELAPDDVSAATSAIFSRIVK